MFCAGIDTVYNVYFVFVHANRMLRSSAQLPRTILTKYILF